MQRTAAGLSAGARASEAELVDRARGRDEAALREIMQANNRRLYRLARGILRSDSEAEDVVQETYVRAFTHLDDFRGESGLSTWLSRIAINEALGRARSRKPHVELERAAGRGTRRADHKISRFSRRRSGKDHGPT